VENGQLVREVTQFKMLGAGQHPPGGTEVLHAEGNTYVPFGSPQRTSTSFREWVLDLLDGKPVPETWIPARTAAAVSFLGFPD